MCIYESINIQKVHPLTCMQKHRIPPSIQFNDILKQCHTSKRTDALTSHRHTQGEWSLSVEIVLDVND